MVFLDSFSGYPVENDTCHENKDAKKNTYPLKVNSIGKVKGLMHRNTGYRKIQGGADKCQKGTVLCHFGTLKCKFFAQN